MTHHDPVAAIELLAEIGYRSVALTLDHATLNPYGEALAEQEARIGDALRRHGMRSVIETGARFLLDPRVKHEPTLVTADRRGRVRRADFLRRAADIAVRIGADCVSFWSGIVRDDASEHAAMDRFCEAVSPVLDHAAERGVLFALEPEPEMLVDTLACFERLCQRIPADRLQLTIDIGHLHCQGETPVEDHIVRWAPRIANVHLEDMRSGVHEHLMFGEGEIAFGPVIDALQRTGYQGGAHVELSRHSHEGPQAARRAFEFLSPFLRGGQER